MDEVSEQPQPGAAARAALEDFSLEKVAGPGVQLHLGQPGVRRTHRFTAEFPVEGRYEEDVGGGGRPRALGVLCRRDGVDRGIAGDQLCVGDIVQFSEGDPVIWVDCIVLQADKGTRADKSAVTGDDEPVPVRPFPQAGAPVDEELSELESPHVLLEGMRLARGRVIAVVVAGGDDTAMAVLGQVMRSGGRRRSCVIQ